LFFDYWRQHRVEIKVARLFNTYGPRMSPGDGRVVSSFVVAALCGKPLVLHGSGRQTRSFCYVDDLVEGLISLMATSAEVTGPMNLGSTDECSIRSLADLVLELTDSSSSLTHAPSPIDDPCQRRPDISLARKVLGWMPSTSLRTGLAQTITYFRDAGSEYETTEGGSDAGIARG
jgi:UDP-glucuronate decarboxylase